MFRPTVFRRIVCLALSLTFVPSATYAADPSPREHRFSSTAVQTLVSDAFTETASAANAWLAVGDACLTAGTTSTPSTSIPACGANAPQDAAGSGALQLTPATANQTGMAVYGTPLPTANGLVITYSYAALCPNANAADGMTSFLTDASNGIPTATGAPGASLAYAGPNGIANAYVGIGLDSYGNFSTSGTGRSGGPGQIADRIVVRGSAATTYAYLGGNVNAQGSAASLPFALYATNTTTRPTSPQTIQETLTPAGALSVAIDRHDGNGFVTYYSQTILGSGGEGAVPANVYLGFAGSTGGYDERHLITNLTVTTIGSATTPAPTPTPTASPSAPVPTASPALGDAFSEATTSPGAWTFAGDACLTAGANAPSTSIPACGANAPLDSVGQGALLLTTATTYQVGMVVANTPVSTAKGLHVTFSDAAFDGSKTAGDGVVLFVTDASAAEPTVAGASGGALGYGSGSVAGLAHAYLGIGFDESGNFSSSASGTGGPGHVVETIALRGAAALKYPYLGGYQNASGQAASLPFTLDTPTSKTRPATAPTIDVLLSPTGQLTVSIDRHDGNGFVAYLSQQIVGVAGQPALPANVYVGLTASTGANDGVHQVYGFSVDAAPSTLPVAAFAPTSIANLQAWYDASNPANLALSGSSVTAWNDLSGNANNLAQATASLQPTFTSGGIDGRGSVSFSGAPYLVTSNGAFSTSLFNESTVFFVTNQSTTTQSSSIGSAGAFNGTQRWDLRLTEGGVTHFDFNNKAAGRLAPSDVATGPALWTAAGSLSTNAEQIRKNGNTLSSSTGPGGSAITGAYPFVVGATTAGGGASTGYQYTGQIGEIVVYNRYLSPSEMASIEGYLACKWGLQNRLPANHPYRTTCPQGGTSVSLPIAAPASGALVDPPQLRSSNGQLVFNVVAAAASDGSPSLTYNGSAVPPTLRVLPGDTVIVNLTNDLPSPPAGAAYLNDTNLHYHGLHVNPNAPGDDSIDLLAMPGQSLHYQFTIPADHPTGLYWYHSHAHGEAERQNLSGMSGALIVDGISQYAPQLTSMPERVLIVRDVLPAGSTLPNADRKQIGAMMWAMRHTAHSLRGMSPSHVSMNVSVRAASSAKARNPYVVVDPKYRHFARLAASADTHCTGTETAAKNWAVNGQSVPTIGIRPNEQQFWRLVNAGSDSYLDLAVDNAQMQIVALDGVPLASVGSPALTVSHYVVPPASRIEFVVTGPAAGTTAYLRTNCFDAGSSGPAMPAAVLAQISATTSVTDAARLRDRVAKRAVRHRTQHTAAYIRRFVATASTPLRMQTLTYSDQLTINGVSYDPGAAAQFYAQAGTMEQWQIVNNSSQVHTFHIHQVHFLVDQIVGGTPIEQSNVGQVLDNVNVPAANANGPGTVTLTMDFTDPSIVGTFLLHCHILSHEDAGMMAKITVGTAPPLVLGSPNGITFASATAPSQTVSITGGRAPYSVNGCSGVASATISGANVVVSPSGAGGCVLTVADSSGLTANLSVTVNGAAAVVSVSPNALAFTSPSAASLSATISGGTAPYTVGGCTNVATTSISGTTLTVKPAAVGSCTATITDSASNAATISITVNAPSTGSPIDNLTFHGNAARTGWYSAETHLTSANVASSKFGLLGTLTAPSGMPAFGKVYAQPLYASAENIGGTTHNLVLVSTMTDQVYAFDDQTEKVVWERNFTNPSAGITQQSYTDTGCDDVNPDIGIASTPVIDRSSDRMFVVVATKENGVFHLRLHAISLQNGSDAVTPVEVSASTMLSTGGTATTDAEYNFSRTALLEANGNIYVGLGSHCDYGQSHVHGWLLSYAASNLAAAGTAVDLTNANPGNGNYLGAIWMSGFGPAADAQGNVYFATGNGPFNGTTDFSMSILKLPGTLNLSGASYFSPSNEASLSSSDTDLGSGGVMVLPDGTSSTYPHLAIGGGKDGVKFMLNRDDMGGQQSGEAGTVWHATVGGGMWGGPAFFQDASANSYVVYGNGNPLSTYLVSATNGSLSAVANSANLGCLECRNSGSQPIVSSNGTTAGSAVVWALKTPSNGGGTITLYAFDALSMKTLFSGAAGQWTVGSGASYIAGALVSPVVANGRVYVPTDGSVAVFGLSP